MSKKQELNIVTDETMIEKIKAYKEVLDLIKDLEKQADEVKKEIIAAYDNQTIMVDDQVVKVTTTTSERKSVNTKSLTLLAKEMKFDIPYDVKVVSTTRVSFLKNGDE